MVLFVGGLWASASVADKGPSPSSPRAQAVDAAKGDDDKGDDDKGDDDTVETEAESETGAAADIDADVPPRPVKIVAPPETTTRDMMLSFLKTMVALCAVLAIVWLTLSKGMGKLVERAQAGKRVKVLERIALDARRSLYLVEVDGQQIVLGGGDVTRIDIEPIAPDKKKRGGRDFREVLDEKDPSKTAPPSTEQA